MIIRGLVLSIQQLHFTVQREKGLFVYLTYFFDNYRIVMCFY